MPDNRKPLIYGAFPVCRNYTVRAYLRPRHHRRTAQGGANDGQYPIPCGIDLSAIRSRWGQRLGQEKSSGRKQQLMQTKRPETLRFQAFLARREGFEPPAFWSVGCLGEKTESFRLRFMLFTTVCWTDFPLFPSGSARSNSILGQKWVKISSQAVFKAGMSFIKVSHTEGMSIEL